MDLSVEDHIETMKIFANWVDAGISKTINLPNDYSYDDFKDVYIDAWKSGIKGVTTYRVGTMTSVLSETSSGEDKITKTEAPKRPKELNCDVHHTSVKGKQYFVLVGLYNGDPYEVFAGINGHIDRKNKKGKIVKVRRNKYKCELEDGDDFCPINFSCDEHEDAVTRLTSTSLRHGADVSFVVGQLEKNIGDLQSFSKAIARALKKYIPDGTKAQGLCPDCEKESLIRQEGCILCQGCGFSRCQ
jgi:ribonucleoside-diphosphate reductase alpha chain